MSSASELFRKIEELIPTLDGWCTPERACELAAMVVALKPKTTCVLGVFGGRDLLAMALAHQFNGFGKCVGVDPWLASKSVLGQTGENATWWADQERHDQVYARFMQAVERTGLREWVDIRKQTSAEATPPDRIGVLISDGNHGPESIADIMKWAPRVPVGSICYADDLQWDGGAVLESVKRLQKMGFVRMHDRDTGAFFQRVK